VAAALAAGTAAALAASAQAHASAGRRRLVPRAGAAGGRLRAALEEMSRTVLAGWAAVIRLGCGWPSVMRVW
jgi:hypothetical protein